MTGPTSNWGHPVAYHPMLSRFFKSVNAALFFCQLRYWSDKTQNPLGVYKASEEWTEETGLSYREQVTARNVLSAAGYVIETNKRIEHRLFFLIDWAVFNPAFEAWSLENVRTAKSSLGNNPKRSSGTAESAVRGMRNQRSSIDTETTAETTTERESADAHRPPMTGAICMVMRASGMQGVNPSHPKLQALIDKGADVGMFAEVTAKCVREGKPFTYVLAVIEGQMKDAAALAEQALSAPVAAAETVYQRSMRERMAEVSPLLARPAPGAKPAENVVTFFEQIGRTK